MSDENLPRSWGSVVPSKARVIGMAIKAAFPGSTERSQAEAGKASAAVAVSSSEDIEAFGTAADTAQAEKLAAKGKQQSVTTSRDIEHEGFVGHEDARAAEDEADTGAEADTPAGATGASAAVSERPSSPAPAPATTAEPVATAAGAGTGVTGEGDDPALVPDPAAAAFFDVDNTLIQGASILLLARGMAKHKFFTSRDLATMAWQQAKFRISGRESMSDVSSGREKALGFVKGRTTQELRDLCTDVFEESITDKFWPGTKALAQMHIDAGQQVWLVTATPVELAAVIAERLGLTGALGTVAEHENGVYTGRLVGDILHGPGKAFAVAELAAQKGFDLSKCYAYSDSSNDLPMLELVGNAVAVNPDAKLRDAARDNGWQIKDYRTMRRAAKLGLQGTAVAAAAGGAVAVWRKRS